MQTALGREEHYKKGKSARVYVVPGWLILVRLGILVSLRGNLEASGAIRYRSVVGQVNCDIFVQSSVSSNGQAHVPEKRREE